MFFLKVPVERVPILIGKEGRVKKYLEEIAGIKIYVNSRTGDVTIDPQDHPYEALKVRNVVMAIGYGFSPENAMKLLNDNYIMEVIDVKDFTRKKSRMIELMGRVIGTRGRARKELEELTDTNISVYEHYIAIIGEYENVDIARRAIEMLLKGSMHQTVYRFIREERRRRMYRDVGIDAYYEMINKGP
ncbi:MAG: RNA-processing protein [Euryarchaeota archaeon]|nr:RNA-processing protein [Euryarchaeota archaeon]